MFLISRFTSSCMLVRSFLYTGVSDVYKRQRSKNVTAGDGAVKLTFAHRMRRLNVRLVKGDDYYGELPEEAEVYVQNTVPSSTIDLSAGFVTKNPYGTAATIRAMKTGTYQYSAILVPQRIDNSLSLIHIYRVGCFERSNGS